MKEVSFEVYEGKDKIKFTVSREDDGTMTVVQTGSKDGKMVMSLECTKKVMEALAYLIR
jgi:hypothetical protein